jgi:hypothetical protein
MEAANAVMNLVVKQVPKEKLINVKDMAAATDVMNLVVKQVPEKKLINV